MGWTDERVSLLRKLWTDGLSAAQIAKQLGGVTRNAVIGKVHRLGLAGRATPSRPAKRPARAARPARPMASPTAPRLRTTPTLPAVSLPALEPLVLADGATASVLTLTEQMCKFPIGDPTDHDFAFCGRDVGGSTGPYCGYHARLAYTPSQPRRRRMLVNEELRRLTRGPVL
jgi:GcrA cell cycle regulator